MEISAIVPTWKGAAFIGDTIDSILGGDHPVAELVVVDDGSPDDTAALVARYGPPVRLLRIANSGTTAARAAGVAAARHPWLAFCDHDDLWQPDHLARLAELATTHSVPFAFSNFIHLHGNTPAPRSHFACDPGEFWTRPGRETGDGRFVADTPLLPHVLDYQAIFPSCTLISRAFCARQGGLDPAFGRNVSEDLEFTLRCVRAAPSGIDTRPTVHIRRHGTNYSGDRVRGLAGSIEILRYAKAHHGLPAAWRSMIDREIIHRSIEAIDHAFPDRRFAEIGSLTGNIPVTSLPWKTALKAVIAALPKAVAGNAATLLTRGGGPVRQGSHHART